MPRTVSEAEEMVLAELATVPADVVHLHITERQDNCSFVDVGANGIVANIRELAFQKRSVNKSIALLHTTSGSGP
jgi:hypothetical protein